jgi:hypothetical protein
VTRIQRDCVNRGITRLCHFTQSRNLAHILGDCTGILSRRSLESAGLPHNPTDPERYDGCDHLICCSLEYPNTYYFAKVREQDHLFKDWVVLLIKLDFLWTAETMFCPCNAATARGRYVGAGYDAFLSLFANTAPGISFTRPRTHLLCAPTNIQAEVLIPDPIALDAIMAIAVESDTQAEREICRATLQGLSLDKQILVVPDFYNRTRLARFIQGGNRVTEYIYNNGGSHGQ